MSIFESKYPKAQAEFILDQSPCHKKLPEDALNIHIMNVNQIRKQPQMIGKKEKAYRDEKIGAAVEEAVKIYKSHQRVNFE